MVFLATFSPSTCTTAREYRPAGLGERVLGVVGRFEFRMALYPLETAACLVAATLPQVPAMTTPAAHWPCQPTEPEGITDMRDYTGERAARIDVNSASTRSGGPGTGELKYEGFAPVVTVSDIKGT